LFCNCIAHLLSEAFYVGEEVLHQHQVAVRLGQADEVDGAAVPGGALKLEVAAATCLSQCRRRLKRQP